MSAQSVRQNPSGGISVDQVNYLNIGLMLLSGGLALLHPFAVFLFSYAVLGPLHYLTEISWLHDRKYFTKHRYDYLILCSIGVVFTLNMLGTFSAPGTMMTSLLYMTLVAAGLFAFTASARTRVIILGCAALFLPAVWGSDTMLVILGVFLPTIIHVFLFTGMFILAGIIKQKSASGVLSLVVFGIVSSTLLLWHPAWSGYTVAGDYIRSSYGEISSKGNASGFVTVNYVLLKMLAPHSFPTASATITGVNAFLYQHPIARSVMAFIAFAYTYHYLNWFSKTSVIRWHKVPKKRLSIILAIWAASLGVYISDYQLGTRWLFFLSFLHVLLELPLNHITFRNIVAGLHSRSSLQASSSHNPA